MDAEAGRNAIAWNGRVRRRGKSVPAPTGIYVLELTARDDDETDSDSATVRLRPRSRER